MFDPPRNDPRFQTLVVSPRSERTMKLNPAPILKGASLNNVLDIPISHLVRVTVARSDDLLPQPKETFAAFPSGDCCLGHPKVKLFALERSPNVSHRNYYRTVYPNLCRISLRLADRLCATPTTAVSFASDKLTQTHPIAEISN